LSRWCRKNAAASAAPVVGVARSFLAIFASTTGRSPSGSPSTPDADRTRSADRLGSAPDACWSRIVSMYRRRWSNGSASPPPDPETSGPASRTGAPAPPVIPPPAPSTA
jgi:hypothetical protein